MIILICISKGGRFMSKINKQFTIKFAIAFASTVAVLIFMIFVILRSMFANIYISKANASFDKGDYEQALEYFETAKYWKKKNQTVHIGLAKTYVAKEDFETAGKLIDEAITKKITSSESGLEQLHLMRIKIFSAAGQLSSAVNYIDSLDNQYMLKKIQAVRPSDITYSPTQGSYDQNLKMTINVREGETVYYTTDGTYPTKFSNTYTSPIKIGNGNTKITAISVDSEGLVSPMLSVTYEVTNENEAVEFDDAKIEKMVRKALSKTNGIIRVKELAGVTELSNDGIDGYVRTLSDLDLMPNLESLCLAGEKNLISISQLSGKSKLKTLYLSGCSVDSEKINALGSLSALEFLDISSNTVTSITALSELTNLKYVYLSGNRIADLSPLAASENIQFIDASGNSITSIPDFNSAEKLETLLLKNNLINDISTIHRLTTLKYLDLENNIIKQGKNIASLVNLETLVLTGNPMVSFDFLSSLTKLTSLDVNSTDFMNLKPIENLPLTTLSASKTELANISSLEKFQNLSYLEIADTNVTDISVLEKMKKLEYLDISNLKILDPAPLFTMKSLASLKATGLDFKGIVFANPNLQIIE